MQQKKITLIGAGNVGHHLALQLKRCGFILNQIYSKTKENALSLANLVQAEAINELHKIQATADIYIIAVKDDAILPVAKALPQLKSKLVVHTSGAVPSTALAPFFDAYGVFYPLQSFSKHKTIDFWQVPLCVFSPQQAPVLMQLAKDISHYTYPINDAQRARLHIAAVFMNNFSNFMVGIAEDLCQQEEVPFEILEPLLKQTFEKLKQGSARTVQTGPAARGDKVTLEKHQTLLSKHPAYLEIYQVISKQLPIWLEKDL